jgi:drug/metabolite transporter (DMT)-like permease
MHGRFDVGGFGLGGLGVLAFSVTLPATRVAVPVFGPWTVGIGRAVIAAALAGLALRLVPSPRPVGAEWRSLLVVAAGGVLGFPVFSALAMGHVPATRGAVVIGLLPAATAVYATVRGGERPSPAFWAAAGAGLVAVLAFVATTGAGLRPQAGDVLLLGAVASAATAYGEGGRLARRLGGWQTICWALLVALPVTVPGALVAVVAHGTVDPTPTSVLAFAYVAAVSMLLGFFAWYAGLARGGVASVSQVQLAQPVLTLVWSWAFLGERVTTATLVAAAAVLACVALTRRTAVTAAPTPTPVPVRTSPPSPGPTVVAATSVPSPGAPGTPVRTDAGPAATPAA